MIAHGNNVDSALQLWIIENILRILHRCRNCSGWGSHGCFTHYWPENLITHHSLQRHCRRMRLSLAKNEFCAGNENFGAGGDRVEDERLSTGKEGVN